MNENLSRLNAVLERLITARNLVARYGDYDFDIRSVLPQAEVAVNVLFEEIYSEVKEIHNG